MRFARHPASPATCTGFMPLRSALAAGFLLALALPVAAEGLQLGPDTTTPLRWQARIQLTQLDGASRLLSANLLGDYYLTGSGLGQKVSGGLRLSGGLLMGSPGLAQSSAGLSLADVRTGQGLAFGQRSIRLSGPQAGALPDANPSMSYLGIGYTGQSLRGGWAFSADLGMARANGTDLLQLGHGGTGQSLDEVLMDMRFRPVVQLGLHYSF